MWKQVNFGNEKKSYTVLEITNKKTIYFSGQRTMHHVREMNMMLKDVTLRYVFVQSIIS